MTCPFIILSIFEKSAQNMIIVVVHNQIFHETLQKNFKRKNLFLWRKFFSNKFSEK